MKTIILLVVSVVIFFIGSAQPSIQKLKSNIQQEYLDIVSRFEINPNDSRQATLVFSNNSTLTLSNAKSWLAQQLELRPDDQLISVNKTTTKDGTVIETLMQYYKGIKTEHGTVNICAKDGKIQMMHFEFYPVENGFAVEPTLSEEQAFLKALEYVNAKKYAWEGYTRNDTNLQKPRGVITIVKDYSHEQQKICLAYRFMIHAVEPFSEEDIYVNAQDGNLIFKNGLIDYSNETGIAQTRYSGTQVIITDDFLNNTPPYYQLKQQRNGHRIETLDGSSFIFNSFTDADNNWNWIDNDGSALDVHFNMQIISDYWKNIQSRNSWDQNNADVLNYVHVNSFNGDDFSNNAFWNNDNHTLSYGDGGSLNQNKPWVSLDICAHEFAHGIFLKDRNFKKVLFGEPGTLNEGFSDIFAACVEKYVKQHYASMENKNIWYFGEQITPDSWMDINGLKDGIRNMQYPESTFRYSNNPRPQPNTYLIDPNWINPNDISKQNDYGGIHRNTGISSKWFYLITEGGTGKNRNNFSYNITGLGFTVSEQIAYETELLLSSNSDFRSAAAISIGVAHSYGPATEKIVKDAWYAVGVVPKDDVNSIPAFTSDDFTTVAIGKQGYIWAGTLQKGLYKNDGSKWQKSTELANNRIHGIQSDKSGGIWIAQSGNNGFNATDGGLEYFADTSFTRIHYGAVHGLPSKNVHSVYLDTSRTSTGNFPVVWTANVYDRTTTSTYTNGGVGRGLNTTSPNFSTFRGGLETTYGTAFCQTVGGNASEIWTWAFNNYGKSQVLRYNAQTNAYLGFYDSTNVTGGFLSKNFQAKSIYFDILKVKWLGMLSKGLVMQDAALKWHKLNDISIFNDTTYVNDNAITGDKYGNVFIGTNRGLLIYNGGALDSAKSFRSYASSNDYLSSNIRGIALDTANDRLVMATSKGIAYYSCPSCLVPDLNVGNLKTGLWSDVTTWDNGRIPDANTDVIISSTVTVDINAVCKSLKANPSAHVSVNQGKTLNIVNQSISTVIH